MNQIPYQALTRISLGVGIVVALSSLEPALAQTRRRTVSGDRGGSFSTTRQVQNNGDGSFRHSGTYTGTSPSGQSRSGSFSGSGERSWTRGEGVSRSDNTEITTSGGRSFSVDRDTNTTYQPGEGLQRTRNTTLRNGEGEVLGTSSGSSLINRDGAESSTTFTGRQGRSATVDSTVTPESQGRFRRSTTVSNDEGEIIGGANTTIEVEGELGQGWTRRVTGSTDSGRPIDRTITHEPVDEEEGL